jgi:uncharacterized protein YeaO (DUF488 family)
MAHGRAGAVRAARVYEPPGPDDGTRVLVDRLWPRGVAKATAVFDEWLPDVAPTTELRRWYSHDPARFDEFAARYRTELERPEPAAALASLRALRRRGPVTLLTATKLLDHSHAAVLALVVPEAD